METAPDGEERALKHALSQDRAAGRALQWEGEAPHAEAIAPLDSGRSVVGRRDDDPLPAPGQRLGQGRCAPLGPAGSVRREILVGETDAHAAASRTVASPPA